jgi:hypothetical protein
VFVIGGDGVARLALFEFELAARTWFIDEFASGRLMAGLAAGEILLSIIAASACCWLSMDDDDEDDKEAADECCLPVSLLPRGEVACRAAMDGRGEWDGVSGCCFICMVAVCDFWDNVEDELAADDDE